MRVFLALLALLTLLTLVAVVALLAGEVRMMVTLLVAWMTVALTLVALQMLMLTLVVVVVLAVLVALAVLTGRLGSWRRCCGGGSRGGGELPWLPTGSMSWSCTAG